MSNNPCLLVAIGQMDLPRRMVMLCNTGATHNIMSQKAIKKLRDHGVALRFIPKRQERLRAVNDASFNLLEAVQLAITIGVHTYTMDFRVTEDVLVDTIVGYPQMRRSGWKLDLENHALEVRGTKYSFLTYDDFQRIGHMHGIRSFHPIPTYAGGILVIPPNEVAYVPVEMQGEAGEKLAFLNRTLRILNIIKPILTQGLWRWITLR